MSTTPPEVVLAEESVTYVVQVTNDEVNQWVSMPGFSGDDLEEVEQGAEQLRSLKQTVRVLRHTTVETWEVLASGEKEAG